MKNENNVSYYEGNDINKPTNKTIKIFLKAKDLDNHQSGMLIKGLIDNYISNLDYDVDNLDLIKNMGALFSTFSYNSLNNNRLNLISYFY